jgi:hypothetical protein
MITNTAIPVPLRGHVDRQELSMTYSPERSTSCHDFADKYRLSAAQAVVQSGVRRFHLHGCQYDVSFQSCGSWFDCVGACIWITLVSTNPGEQFRVITRAASGKHTRQHSYWVTPQIPLIRDGAAHTLPSAIRGMSLPSVRLIRALLLTIQLKWFTAP